MRADPVRSFAADVFPNFNAVRGGRRQAPRREAGAPCRIESLEVRRLLSYSFSSGILTFTGTSSDDTIVGYRIVNAQGDKVYIHRSAATPEIAGPYESSGAGSVTKVVINGGVGNDVIQFEDGTDVAFNHGNAIWNEVAQVSGGDGHDTLRGGPLAGTVRGEDGDDLLYGYGGNDYLYGGYGGSDTIFGGGGNDLMYGGYGGAFEEYAYDELYGEGGNDTLFGEGGDDYLDPGTDADYAYGGSGNDTFRGSADGFFDWLDGGSGTDDHGGDYDPSDSLFAFP
jgi:Ca2+-binding RTX toxin-like protein